MCSSCCLTLSLHLFCVLARIESCLFLPLHLHEWALWAILIWGHWHPSFCALSSLSFFPSHLQGWRKWLFHSATVQLLHEAIRQRCMIFFRFFFIWVDWCFQMLALVLSFGKQAHWLLRTFGSASVYKGCACWPGVSQWLTFSAKSSISIKMWLFFFMSQCVCSAVTSVANISVVLLILSLNGTNLPINMFSNIQLTPIFLVVATVSQHQSCFNCYLVLTSGPLQFVSMILPFWFFLCWFTHCLKPCLLNVPMTRAKKHFAKCFGSRGWSSFRVWCWMCWPVAWTKPNAKKWNEALSCCC
mgnify:CR=1 FL=1